AACWPNSFDRDESERRKLAAVARHPFAGSDRLVAAGDRLVAARSPGARGCCLVRAALLPEPAPARGAEAPAAGARGTGAGRGARRLPAERLDGVAPVCDDDGRRARSQGG